MAFDPRGVRATASPETRGNRFEAAVFERQVVSQIKTWKASPVCRQVTGTGSVATRRTKLAKCSRLGRTERHSAQAVGIVQDDPPGTGG